ncbi:MAG: RagB/SusD family nutrient uptake outer membrane protein [Muribaculaceae bacterium]|nr:RagB/SusD family nutrient uptake outer membrane protein [Muribaculaceae bacterium]
MKRIYRHIGIILSALTLLTGCNLDFTPTDAVADATITEENYEHLLTGVYDAAQNLPAFHSDTSADNLNSTWTPELDYNSLTAANATIYSYWNSLYKGVQLANNLINLIGDDTRYSHITAQARFLRAYFYHLIAENWGDAPLLVSSGTENAVRTPEADIWKFIISDLEYAASYAPGFTNPGFVSATAAKAFLARVNLIAPQGVGDRAEAVRLAEEVITDGNFALADDPADIWHHKTSREFILYWTNTPNDTGNSGWFLRSSLVPRYEARYGAGSAGYGEFGRYEYPVDMALVRAFEPGDLRLEASIRHLVLDDEETWDCVKYPSYNSADNWPAIRIAEMYLVAAEAAGYPAGVTRLNELREKRGLQTLVPGQEIDAPTFLRRIMEERRIELAFEGFRYYDLRRWFASGDDGKQAVLELSAQAHTPLSSDFFTVSDDGHELLYPVPTKAIDLNPALLPNNPGY